MKIELNTATIIVAAVIIALAAYGLRCLLEKHGTQ